MNMERLVIIDHETHRLYIEDVDEEMLERDYEGSEEAYIEDTYELGKKMVDDIISFYDDEDSPGYGEDATLAVVDLKKLMETTFTRDMKGVVEIMADEARMPTFSDIMFGQLLFYDELRSQSIRQDCASEMN